MDQRDLFPRRAVASNSTQTSAGAGSRLVRRAARLGLVLALGAAMVACGDDDDDGAIAAGPNDGVPATSDDGAESSSLVADAATLVELSQSELVYSTVETPTDTAEIEPYGDWRGPTSAPTPGSASVQVISCASVATGCQAGATGAVEAAEALGWDAQLIDGGGTPQGWAAAFNTAMQRNPDAIVAIGVPTIAVADSLATANDAGVLTVVVADVEPDGGEAFDAYVPYPTDVIWAMGAWAAIAEHGGEAHQIVPQETDYPVFVDAATNYADVIRRCPDCSVDVIDWQFADSMDPGRVDQILGGALSRNPEANGVFVSVGHVVPGLSETLARAGRSDDLSVGVAVADPTAIQVVAQGAADFTVGTPPQWAGWAAIDQVVRGLADEPFLAPTELGFGIGTLTTETAPESGDFDEWSGMIDYRAEYAAIWGIDQ